MRNAVPRSLQSSANILVALSASRMLIPEAITAQTMAPADEPASGVVFCLRELGEKKKDHIYERNLKLENIPKLSTNKLHIAGI